MTTWYEKAEDELDRDLAAGIITIKEYHQGMRDIRDELRQEASDAASAAYDDVMGRF